MKKLETGHYEYTVDELRDICIKKCIDPENQILLFGTTLDQLEEQKTNLKTWFKLEDLP